MILVGLLLYIFCAAAPTVTGLVASESQVPRVAWAPGRDVYEGDTVLLECQVGLEVETPAIWVKLDPHRPNSDEIISHGELLLAENPRLSIERLNDSNTFVLAISKVSAADAGRYQCQVPVSSNQTELREAPPITIALKRSTASQVAAAGASVLHPFSPSLLTAACCCSLLLAQKGLVYR